MHCFTNVRMLTNLLQPSDDYPSFFQLKSGLTAFDGVPVFQVILMSVLFTEKYTFMESIET